MPGISLNSRNSAGTLASRSWDTCIGMTGKQGTLRVHPITLAVPEYHRGTCSKEALGWDGVRKSFTEGGDLRPT